LLAEPSPPPLSIPAGPVVAALPAPVAEPVRPSTGGAADRPVDRTRSGLVKRVKQPALPARHAAVAGPAAPRADRTPDTVRDMLSAFRSGNQRGEHVTAPDGRRALVATARTATPDADEEQP
jgi:hypothetical protein